MQQRCTAFVFAGAQVFRHACDPAYFVLQGYTSHAWGTDELNPLTRRGKISFRLGLTIVSVAIFSFRVEPKNYHADAKLRSLWTAREVHVSSMCILSRALYTKSLVFGTLAWIP